HDWDFALRAAAGGRLEVVPETLLSYRVHGHNTIREDPRSMDLEILWTVAMNAPHHAAAMVRDGDPEALARLLHSVPTRGRERFLALFLMLAATFDGREQMMR